jgi:hypothetical protein
LVRVIALGVGPVGKSNILLVSNGVKS